MLRRRKNRWGQGLVSLCSAFLVSGLAARVEAGPVRTPYVRGEVERLLRHAYDYQYRNSNRNVFRSSRHFHPTRNIFRSSRHYQQKLAASYDGFPLRTTIRFARDRGRGVHEETISFAHPRRYPQGPMGRYYDSFPSSLYGAPYTDFDDRYYDSDSYGYDGWVFASGADGGYGNDSIDGRPRNRSDIPMVEISVPRRAASQQAVMTSVTLEDGTVKTIITNVPLEKEYDSLDDAWKLMAVGDFERAAEAFLDRSLDEGLGAEAILGYGLAQALGGDEEAGRRAVKQALDADAGLLERVQLNERLRGTLDRLLGDSDRESTAE